VQAAEVGGAKMARAGGCLTKSNLHGAPPVKGGHWDLNTFHHYSGHVNNLCLLQTSCNNED